MKAPALLVAVCLALPLAAEKPRDLHWRSELTGTGLPDALTSETWMKGGRIRSVMKTPFGPSTVIVKDGVVYMKTGSIAMKVSADQPGGGVPRPQDYAARLDDLLEKGKKVGEETLDGEVCDKWSVVEEHGGKQTEQLLWVSRKLHFPRQISVRTGTSEIIVKNRDIDTKVTLADDQFEPEAGVVYHDATGPRRLGPAPAAAPASTPPPAAPVTPKAPEPEGSKGQSSDRGR